MMKRFKSGRRVALIFARRGRGRFADGTNYPGQDSIRARQDRLAEALATVYGRLSDDQRLILEYKLSEPAFCHADVPDWGTSFVHCLQLSERAKVCIDTGHHAPGTNIEFIRGGKARRAAGICHAGRRLSQRVASGSSRVRLRRGRRHRGCRPRRRPARGSYTRQVRECLTVLADLIGNPDREAGDREAVLTLGVLVGAITMARAVDNPTCPGTY